MGITEKSGRGYCFPPEVLAQKMKLPVSPWNFEPWACFLIGPGVWLAQHCIKLPKVLPRLTSSGSAGPSNCGQPGEFPLPQPAEAKRGLDSLYVDVRIVPVEGKFAFILGSRWGWITFMCAVGWKNVPLKKNPNAPFSYFMSPVQIVYFPSTRATFCRSWLITAYISKYWTPNVDMMFRLRKKKKKHPPNLVRSLMIIPTSG